MSMDFVCVFIKSLSKEKSYVSEFVYSLDIYVIISF